MNSKSILFINQGHLGSPLYCRPPYVSKEQNFFEFIGIAIHQVKLTSFLGETTPEETITMFLNVKLEREWIFGVVNDKKVQFKSEFGSDELSEVVVERDNSNSNQPLLNIIMCLTVLVPLSFCNLASR